MVGIGRQAAGGVDVVVVATPLDLLRDLVVTSPAPELAVVGIKKQRRIVSVRSPVVNVHSPRGVDAAAPGALAGIASEDAITQAGAWPTPTLTVVEFCRHCF
jgi:hypothetical protein